MNSSLNTKAEKMETKKKCIWFENIVIAITMVYMFSVILALVYREYAYVHGAMMAISAAISLPFLAVKQKKRFWKTFYWIGTVLITYIGTAIFLKEYGILILPKF